MKCQSCSSRWRRLVLKEQQHFEKQEEMYWQVLFLMITNKDYGKKNVVFDNNIKNILLCGENFKFYVLEVKHVKENIYNVSRIF